MFLSIGVPFIWVATEGEGHKLEFEAVSVLSIGCTLRLREQDLANPTPLDTANHWKPGHESAGKFWDATMPTHWHCCTTAC